MAGDHGAIKHDPAFERWNRMRENVYLGFRFTPSLTRKVVLWGVGFPIGIYYLAKATDGQWELRGKGKQETLLRHPPPPAATAETEE